MELDLLATLQRYALFLQRLFTNAEENLAARYLRLLGFTVLSRNDRRFGAELDLLCAQHTPDEFFIFEVKKMRSRNDDSYPKISALQLRRLKHTAAKIQAAAGKFLTVRLVILLVDALAGKVEMIADAG